MPDDPSLRIFPEEYVPNAEGADYHRRWVKANPAEASKWAAFRDAVKAGNQVAAPSMASRYGKALVAAGKEHMSISRLVGQVQNPYPPPDPPPVGPPPPPPPGDKATKRSVGYLRYGDGELPVSHTGDYDMIVTSWAGASAAGASTAKRALHYMSEISCKTGAGGAYHFGVTSEEARANGWVLLDSVGAEMTNFQYGGSAVPLGDPGNTGYQQRWAENVTARLQATSCDGVFIDDTLFWTTGMSNGQVPLNYTQPQWVEAERQFMAYIGAYLNQRGLYVVANASGWFPGTTDYAGDNDLTLWTALAPYIDGLNCETWMWHPAFATPQTVRVLGAGWNQNWDGWMRLPALCETQGIDFHCISGSTSSVTADYQLYSLLLENQGTMYFTVGDSPYANYDRNFVWHSTYDQLPLGLPSGAKVQNGALWERQFANARIWVNPTAGTAGIY